MSLDCQGETAARLYQTLDAAAQQEVGPEPEVLVRLALLLGRRDLTEGMPAEGKTGWLGHFLREGEDPLAEMIWRGVQVKVRSGPADIIMPGACPHCGHEAAVHFPISLVVSREALCGACFGRQAIHWAGIEAYLEDTRADFLTLDVRETDWDLIDAVRPLLQPGSDAPEVVQNLGQEYQFLLNEILAGHLLSGGGGAAGTERP
ncbi:hypothetical protein CSB20_10725 [bacterium DOLZORAL124_64_63]|nr:MAG: hypothetical protein CSB20_10725 [bacterium DOLZORAL124_64_63]